jgi:hypothetical protein
MKLNYYVKTLSIFAIVASGAASADVTGNSESINYTWMNAVINKTPVVSAACPSIETDVYGAGFKVARSTSFYGSLSASRARWFPNNAQWASVGVGPVRNNFGVYYTDIDKLSELADVKEKKLPDNYEEINKWKVSDSAYWESQGGVSLYIGTGISPIDIGVFAVATGGWANFLQKTGPNKVYVEMSKKKIRSVSIGAGLGVPNIGLGKAFEDSRGFAYEFTLDNQENIESFERFMAGDVTKAQELSKFKDSGVNKISDLSDSRVGLTRSFGMATPFIPILSFKTSSENAYDHSEENSVWDEKSMKDTGIYIKQRNIYLLGEQFKEARSFIGGRTLSEVPGLEGISNKTEKLYGSFKFTYQSNWGQERRLRKYISKVKSLTGLVEETCARVPSFKDTLGFNQVNLEVSWSDEYVREILNLRKSNTNLLNKIKTLALHYQASTDGDKSVSNICSVIDNDNYDDTCTASNSDKVESIFKNLQAYSDNMNKTIKTDRKEFSKNLAKFGEEVWKSPAVFKAFYEKGKLCGQDFKFEVSGQRLTRHLIDQKFAYSAACASL